MTLTCHVALERWPLREPFEIAREVMTDVTVILATLTDTAGRRGRGEAAGIDYDGETPQTMAAQIDAVAPRLIDDLTGSDLMQMLPPGGARNALDAALWDLRARRSGVRAETAAGVGPCRALATAFTIGLGSMADMRRRAREAREHTLLKLKVDARRHLSAVRAVRDERPDARLIIDANQAWTAALLDQLLPGLHAEAVELIEQPLPRGQDAALSDLDSPIPFCADESCTDRASLPALLGRYQAINIKLDKCGGLTEALALAREARGLGFELMVGNMCGSSLAMAPAFLIGQLCRWVDLDGPLLQLTDRDAPMAYHQGRVDPPSPALWG